MSAHPHPQAPRVDSQRALATATLVVSGVLALCLVLSSVGSILVARAMSDGTPYEDLSWVYPLAEGLPAVGAFLFGIVSWVVTSIWLVRTQRSARLLYPYAQQRRHPAWVVLGWVVPIANFFVPHMVVSDLTRADGRGRDVTGWWWGTWLVWLLIGRFAQTSVSTSLGASAGATVVVNVLFIVLTVAALVFWVGVIRAITTTLEDPTARNEFAMRYRQWAAGAR